jgi:hypothetical protein
MTLPLTSGTGKTAAIYCALRKSLAGNDFPCGSDQGKTAIAKAGKDETDQEIAGC